MGECFVMSNDVEKGMKLG